MRFFGLSCWELDYHCFAMKALKGITIAHRVDVDSGIAAVAHIPLPFKLGVYYLVQLPSIPPFNPTISTMTPKNSNA